jgi:2-amino-4-hydroxy-6-hydroxymethyldihydropteridine diphosphokinase
VRAFVGLGANLGSREETLLRAVEFLGAEDGVEVVALSRFRETDPVGVEDQPRFLNAAVLLETTLEPRGLLDVLLRVERELGRVRDGTRWGPRVIDLDLLAYGTEVVDEPGLACTAPHDDASCWSSRRGSDLGYRGGKGRTPRPSTLTRHVALDELDEFEAGSISLRQESPRSSACSVLRPHPGRDVPCNKLDLGAAAGGYPYFPCMEDVWVWDRAASRIIRGQVYTSGDVTVEELRGEGGRA